MINTQPAKKYVNDNVLILSIEEITHQRNEHSFILKNLFVLICAPSRIFTHRREKSKIDCFAKELERGKLFSSIYILFCLKSCNF